MSAAARSEPSREPSADAGPSAPIVERVIASFAAKGRARTEIGIGRWMGAPAVIVRRFNGAGELRTFAWPAEDLDDMLAGLGVARGLLVRAHGPGTTGTGYGRRHARAGR